MPKKSFAKVRNKQKARRAVLQALILLAVFAGIWFLATQVPANVGEGDIAPTPTPAAVFAPSVQAAMPMQRDKGFIALSYFGVAEEATETVIGRQRLTEQLQALYDCGYVTISQQDLYGYYYEGKALPEKALFLFFEDGLKRSMLLAQPILEKLGYQASMLCYANNLEENDGFFLSAEDLLAMEATGYWSTGVNGYRLSYINVFDRHENYLGEMTPSEFRFVAPYLRREYNHYLMDYIRDQYSVPMETHVQMAQRIENDYRMMEEVYTARLGRLPALYTLMHANTDQYATNDQVSVENEKWIGALFALNFNREMLSVNDAAVRPSDLTRMQPQAYWSVNHLLMRIADDTEGWQDMAFVTGDAAQAAQWDILRGVAQWDKGTIRVTTLPEGEGLIRMKGSEGQSDFYVSAYFDGNLMGKQSLDILADAEGNAYTAVELEKNVLNIYAANAGAAGEPVFTLDLDKLDGVVYPTMEEDRQAAMAVEIDVKLRQTYKPDESKKIAESLAQRLILNKASNDEFYIAEKQLNDDGSRFVEVVVRGGQLYVSIDHKLVVSALPLPAGQGGGWALRAGWTEYGYSQRNLADDVYDADFRDLYVSSTDGGQIYADYHIPEPEVVVTTEVEVDASTGWQRLWEWLGIADLPLGGKE